MVEVRLHAYSPPVLELAKVDEHSAPTAIGSPGTLSLDLDHDSVRVAVNVSTLTIVILEAVSSLKGEGLGYLHLTTVHSRMRSRGMFLVIWRSMTRRSVLS